MSKSALEKEARDLRQSIESLDSSKQAEQIENLLKRDNVPSLVHDAIPQGLFERHFSVTRFNTMIHHCDPNLQALGSYVHDGSVDFRKEALECSLNHLKNSYKAEQFAQGGKALVVVIKYLANASALAKEECERILNVVTLYSNNTMDADITSRVVVIIAKCIELCKPEPTGQILKSIIEDLMLTGTKQTLTTAFSLLSQLFHVNSALAQDIFVLPSIQQQQLDKSHFVSESVVVAALEALSSACVNKECRTMVAANFETIVNEAMQSQKSSIQLLASSILVKIKASSDTNTKGEHTKEMITLSEIFESTIAQQDDDRTYYGVALEGLAYTSLITAVKQRIIDRSSLIENLVKIVKEDITQTPWVYCSLCILANLTEYPPLLSEEQAKMKDLKSYASNQQPSQDTKEATDQVAQRCKTVLDTGVVGIVSKNAPRFTLSSRGATAVLMRNLVTEKSHRGKFAQQGGLTVAIYLLLPQDNVPPLDAQNTAIATSALAKTLISIDPAIALSNKVSPNVTIKPLVSQLGESSSGTLLDTFEALLALTNLAAGDDDTGRDLIVNDAFAKIEMLMTSSNNPLVQRASVELICNLAMSAKCAEKFLDESTPANSRLDIVAVLTEVDDKPSRLAATGALALLSEWGPAPKVMAKREKVVGKLLAAMDGYRDDNDMIIRAAVAIKNICTGGGADAVKGRGGVDKLRAVVQSCKDPEIVSTCMEAIKSMV